MINFNELKNLDLSHTKVVITGANNGLGFETARYFAINGAQVFMTSRSEEKGKAAILKIKEETPNANVVQRCALVSTVSKAVQGLIKDEFSCGLGAAVFCYL